ncbi:hypothetical protein [Sneathiella glossodoripedis]|uniref:hypothetical protein n=1 Tax=Sneathiella glossodoripedis TaxID=418853 RepID=UPI0004717F6A|nr:hypothetical protein [Sneathiella glossodoripedis]
MSKISELEKFITAWDEGEVGYFKVAPIRLSVTSNARDLEAAARDAAKEIEAEVSYAWDLGETDSEAWWLEWGGFMLEEEIPYYAANSLPEALEKLKNFDPKNNEFECESIEEFKELLFSAFDEDLKAEDLKRGFRLWLESLSKDALKVLEADLQSWASRAK